MNDIHELSLLIANLRTIHAAIDRTIPEYASTEIDILYMLNDVFDDKLAQIETIINA